VVTKLSELLDDVCAVYRPRLQSTKIKVERNYQIAGEVTIYPSELRQVFTNLITNAIDAIGQQGQLDLAIERASENQVVVRVRDSGCGIPDENLKTIFQPFFTTKGDKGTGIGLWVIKGIVDKLGGKIEVETSTSGTTGTCFSIFLPATKGNGAGESAQSGDTVQAISSRPA
jgi:signal transduction histidine kinase